MCGANCGTTFKNAFLLCYQKKTKPCAHLEIIFFVFGKNEKINLKITDSHTGSIAEFKCLKTSHTKISLNIALNTH